MSDSVISVENISKNYHLYDTSTQRLLSYLLPGRRERGQAFHALQDIDFTLQKGETLGIIGRNGSGKSTLLQIVTGILTPTRGKVHCHGRIAALLELGAGFNPDFTGRENVQLNAAMYGLTKADIDARMNAIIEFAGIGEFIDQPVRHYSSGMFVRLAFSVIVHVDADVLIIDEALAVGDVLFSYKCMRFLEEFKKKGSILFVSHDAGAVSQLCDRVVWLDKGRIMGIGDPKVMLDRYLEHAYSEQQAISRIEAVDDDIDGANVVGGDPVNAQIQNSGSLDFEPWYDAREELIGSPAMYNAIEVDRFEANRTSGFGDGAATITDVCFRDREGRKLSGILGGTPVSLSFTFVAHRDLDQLIVGFLVKDRLGRVVLGDNNCIIHHNTPVNAEADKTYQVRFGLTFPYMALSEYIVSVSVASGSQHAHVQHCWLHYALVFRAEKGPVVHGILGIPMAFCEITEQAQQQ